MPGPGNGKCLLSGTEKRLDVSDSEVALAQRAHPQSQLRLVQFPFVLGH